jgi:hypothetical protein
VRARERCCVVETIGNAFCVDVQPKPARSAFAFYIAHKKAEFARKLKYTTPPTTPHGAPLTVRAPDDIALLRQWEQLPPAAQKPFNDKATRDKREYAVKLYSHV